MSVKFRIPASFCAALFVSALAAAPANASVFSSYGDAHVSGGNFDLISNSDPATPYGGLYYQVSPVDSVTVGGLTNLSANYNMTTGTFAGGAPRFTLFDDSTNGAAYIYFGTPQSGGTFTNPSANNVFSDTGNYADLASMDLRVQSNGFDGYSTGASYVTFADFLANVGGAAGISYVFLDLDAGFAGDQELLVNSFTVNGNVDRVAAAPVPEPVTLSLFGAGLAGAAALRRRKKQTA